MRMDVESEEPLLSRRDFDAHYSGTVFDVRVGLHVQKQLPRIHKLWRLTTSEQYLASSLSRRDIAKPLWSCIAVLSVLVDVLGGNVGLPWMVDFDDASLTYLDIVYLISLVIYLRIRTHSLQLDFFMCCSWGVYYTVFNVLQPSSNVSFLCLPPLLSLVTGLHVSAQMAYFIIVAVRLVWACNVYNLFVFFPTGVVCMVLSGTSAYRCAIVLSQLHTQMSATEQLLDHATDGFCRILNSSGIITSASSKMDQTFGIDVSLQGHCLAHLLQGAADRKSLEKLQASTSDQHELCPILVTCETPSGEEFDARLIPFSASQEELSLCVQLLGEKRKVETTPQQSPMLAGNLEVCDRIDEARTIADGFDCADVVDWDLQSFAPSSQHLTVTSLAYSKSSAEAVQLLARTVAAATCAEHQSQTQDGVGGSAITRNAGTQTLHNDTLPHHRCLTTSQSREPVPAVEAESMRFAETPDRRCFPSGRCETGAQAVKTSTEFCSLCKRALQSPNESQPSSWRPPRPPRVADAAEVSGSIQHSTAAYKSRLGRASRFPRVSLNTRHRALKQFEATPKTSLTLLLGDALIKTNLHGKGCCYWHIGMLALRKHTAELMLSDCRSGFCPNKDWQCESCLMVHDEDGVPDEECPFCCTERPQRKIANSEASHESSMSSRAKESGKDDW